MGFVAGALVQYIPEPNGMTFTLCDENIRKYSELYHSTKEKNGTLMQIYDYRDGLQLTISGSRLDETGLVFGDRLIVCYEHGFVKMRKLPKSPNGGGTTLTTARITGAWLAESGFVINSVITVASETGVIICTLQENGLERTSELVKYARQNKLKLLQVQGRDYKLRLLKNQHQCRHGVILSFDIPPQCLDIAGFAPDELLLAVYEYGTIKLQKPDFVALGF